MENNQVTVAGRIVSDFVFSHRIYGEGFYVADLMVERLSAHADRIPVMVSERLMDVRADHRGECMEVTGQFRSHNRHRQGKSHLELAVFARRVRLPQEEGLQRGSNEIYLDGYLCKPAVYRMTPLGREITDLLIAVNRPYTHSDYIPCICWGRNARYAADFSLGRRVRLTGRIQSREYTKRLPDEQVVRRRAYEVSVSRMVCLPS